MTISTADLKTNTRNELIASIKGEVLFQENPKFEIARTSVWNLDSAGMPAVIVKCKNESDVAAAIKFAKENDIRISVHTAGAHSSHAVVDDTVTIDLSLLRAVTVDVLTRTATVAGGATIGDVDAACKSHMLALPMGHVHHTGVAGMCLNATSGVGYLCRSRGLTASFLKGVTIVMCDGSVKEVNENENSDLLWGMRGAGANFGIVTKMVFSLTKVSKKIFGGDVVKFGKGPGPGMNSDHTRAEIAMKFFEFFDGSPDECNGILVLAPKGPCATRLCYTPSEADSEKPAESIEKEAREAFEPYTSFGKTLVNGTKMIDYWDGIQKMQKVPPSYYYQKGNMVDIPSEDLPKVLDSISNFADTCPVTKMGSGILIMPLGGKLHRLDSASAPTNDVFNKMKWWFIIVIEFPEGPNDPKLRKQCIDWARDAFQVVEPYCATDSGRKKDYWAETIGSIYGNNMPRLKELKSLHDPENIFSLNRNISPN